MEGSSSKELVTCRPPEEFEEVEKDALIELNLDDSKELWLIQWTVNQVTFFLIQLLLFMMNFPVERSLIFVNVQLIENDQFLEINFQLIFC